MSVVPMNLAQPFFQPGSSGVHDVVQLQKQVCLMARIVEENRKPF